METENRLATAGLNRQLRDVRGYSFFQLAHLLERFSALHNRSQRDGQVDSSQDARAHDPALRVRYRALPSLAFPAADVDSCEVHGEDASQFLDVTVTFMGLFGPASPLPAFYSERIIQSTDPHNPARDLMDLFNHRCISLLQTCWEKYRYFSRYQSGGLDQYSRWLLSLSGIDQTLLQQTGRLCWHKLLPLAGILFNNTSCADALEKVVRAYFDLEAVRVQSWIRREIAVAADQCNRMGVVNSSLGEDVVLGDSVVDYGGKFALHLQQLAPQQYTHFLPDGAGFAELVDLVHLVVKDALDFDVHLHPDPRWQQPLQLAETVQERLGWNAILGENIDANGDAVSAQSHCGAPASVAAAVICVSDFFPTF